MATTSSVNGNKEALESVLNDGTIDSIRLKIISHLKAIEELKNNTITMVEQSKVRNSEKQTKRELFDALRQDQETPALERASKSVWELIMDNDGLGKEINETVERVFCPLSGREPPLFPPSNSKVQQDNVKEKENSGKEKESEHLDSSSKKRDFGEMRVQTEEGEAAEVSGNSPSVPVDSDSRTVAADCGITMEPERGRCRRTDGKTWRCSRECIPDTKYCDKHWYRGRKKRKHVENADQGTSSNNRVELDSNPNISSSTVSQLVTSDITNNCSRPL